VTVCDGEVTDRNDGVGREHLYICILRKTVLKEAGMPEHSSITGSADVRPLSVVPPMFDALFAADPSLDFLDEQWQENALCSQTDPEAFFPEKGGSTREAKRICTGCEVRDECLEYALAHDERFGIWGGLSERERRRLKRSAV
jgi:WhiB family redox-sensing transcriptional regulator